MKDDLSAYPEHPLGREAVLTAEHIFAAAAQGDGPARDRLTIYIRHLSAAVVSYIHAHDPDLVVLGGGIMHAADQILPRLEEFVAEHAWTCPKRTIPLRAATLGDSAALVGAAALGRGFARFR
jgi:glucokinase